MLYWIVPFLVINVVSATTKIPTIYIELIDSNKLADMLGKPMKFVPLKRQATDPSSVSDPISSPLYKSNNKNQNENVNIQTIISRNKELDMKLEKQENRKRQKVGKRLLLGRCLKEGKTELEMMHELMRARQLRMNHSITPFADDNLDFMNSLDDEDLDNTATSNPNIFIDLRNPEGVNMAVPEQLQSSMPISPLLNVPSRDYMANKPYSIYQEYPVPNFYWPSQDLRPFQSLEPSRLIKRYGNLTKPVTDSFDPYPFNGNRFSPYHRNAPPKLSQMRYTPN